MATKKPPSLDYKKAFDRASDYDYEHNPFVVPELLEFMKVRAKRAGVTPSMAIPSFLAVTSNLMGKAKV